MIYNLKQDCLRVDRIINKLSSLKTKEEALNFLMEYQKVNLNAWNNIKYITGYLNPDESKRVLNLFKQE